MTAADGFEVLLTVDDNLPFQQNLASAGVAVVIMRAKSNRMADLLPVIPMVEVVLQSIRPGEVVEVP